MAKTAYIAVAAIVILIIAGAAIYLVTQPAAPPGEEEEEEEEEEGPAPRFTIEQTLSDEAQRNTIAFDGLALLTGNLGSQSFLPPGKVADFSGFQYLRDTDPTNMGHNTDFVTIIAFNVLHILTPDQVNQLIDRAQSQVELINEYAYKRFPLMKAFRRLLEGDLPEGCTGLDMQAVMEYSAELYRIDGQISYDRAQMSGSIVRSLTAEQKEAFEALKALNGVGNWDNNLPDPLKDLNLEHDVNVAVMTYASEMYSWYAGSVEADTYFCPERQGTYFGSFYLKDWPAMGNPNYTIDEQLTASAGENFLKVLTSSQAELLTSLVDIQRNDLYEIVERRRDIATELRRFLTEESVDNATVLNLAERYGELDGKIVYYYATHFAEVGQTMSSTQKVELEELVDALGYIPCTGAFLYSWPIDMPEIMNTDFLFSASTSGYTIVDTGQDRCYNNTGEISCPSPGEPFYGQDAQYEGTQPSYQDNGDGTVTDLITGLMWQKSPDRNGDGVINYSDKLYYDEAVALAASFNLAGYTDWRLPTIKELYSLIMFYEAEPNPTATSPGSAVPFIDTNYFDFGWGDLSAGERIIDAQYATSTIYVSTTMNGNRTMFGVNFADGRIKGYPADQTIGKKYYVLYVRGNTNYGISQFVDNGDGTITDKATGLMWTKSDSGTSMNWQEALVWVQTKNAENYLGHSDWRLPNAKELQSIVDYTRSSATTGSAAIDPVFTCTSITNEAGQADYPYYWTGTTHASGDGSGAAAVYVAFGRAMGYMNGVWMDVHGAGAQRSDPKTGNPEDYPYGRGPQGDAIRIYNYVRCVRGGLEH